MRLCIVGTSRCGTTLLRELLHRHPKLALFNETHWLPRMFEFAGCRRVDWRLLYDVATKTTWDSGKDLFTVNCACSRHADVDALLAAFREALGARGRVTIQEFSVLFAETCFGDVASWGDKTPDYGFHMGLLQQLWPNCRFLHIVRDGLDTARSMARHSGCQLMVSAGYDNWCSLSYDRLYEKYQRRDLPLAAYVGSWRRRLERIRDEATRLHPDSYLEVRYEEVKDSTREVLMRVSTWLGLETDQGWLDGADAVVRRRTSPARNGPTLWYTLRPEDLLCLNRESRRPELDLSHTADTDELRQTLRHGETALIAGEFERAARAGLSVLATERGHADTDMACAAVELLLSALRELGEPQAVEHWEAWRTATTANVRDGSPRQGGIGSRDERRSE